MEIKNKYGYMHWWYIFYLLDDFLHNYAINYIDENLTASSNIYYHLPINEDSLDLYDKNINILSKTKNTITLQVIVSKLWENYISWIFTFVRKK